MVVLLSTDILNMLPTPFFGLFYEHVFYIAEPSSDFLKIVLAFCRKLCYDR